MTLHCITASLEPDITDHSKPLYFSGYEAYLTHNSHVGDVSPELVSPVGIVDEGGAEGDGACPGDGLLRGEHGDQVEGELGEAEADHDQGGGHAGELLHVGEHAAHWLQGGGLLAGQSVLLDHFCKCGDLNEMLEYYE